MEKMKVSGRKRAAAVVAVVMAIAIALGGTYAWQSMSEAARNNARGMSGTAGGRLHDDYQAVGVSEWSDNFTANKDIYVENYETLSNDGGDIYVRLKVYEYMETGQGATLNAGDTGYAARTAAPLVTGTDRDDVSTWTPRIPGVDAAGSDLFRAVWEWDMGGAKAYMPTFNRDNHSEETDVKGDALDMGTLDTSGGEQESATKVGGGNAYPLSAGLHDYFSANGAHTAVEKTYDADTSQHLIGIVGTDEIQHTAKSTADATTMTMAAWKAAGSAPGNYWVLDADGWCYWASPLAPETATGLLISGITLRDEPDGEWYYASYVKSEMASGNDWMSSAPNQGFYGDTVEAPSADAEDLLYIVTGHTPAATGVTMSETTVATAIGTPITLTATVSAEYTHDSSYQEVVWSIAPMSVGAFSSGVFTPAANDGGKWFTIRAASVKDTGIYGESKVYVPASGQSVLKQGTGANTVYYVDNGDNTYQKVNAGGTLGALICPTTADQPGAADDRAVAVKYGANVLYDGDGYYYGAGADGKLGAGGDDVLLYDNGSALVTPVIPRNATSFTDSTGIAWTILKDNRAGAAASLDGVVSAGDGTVLMATDKVYGMGDGTNAGMLTSWGRGVIYNTENEFLKYENSTGELRTKMDAFYTSHVSPDLKGIARIPNLTYEMEAPGSALSLAWNQDTAISTPGAKAGAATAGILFPMSVSEVNRYMENTLDARKLYDVEGIMKSSWLRTPGGNTSYPSVILGGAGNLYWRDGSDLCLPNTIGTEGGNWPNGTIGMRPAMWVDTTP